MRDANSDERSPANTRCVWLSTKPGSTHRPPASIRWSAAGARPVPTPTIDEPSNTTWASVRMPSAPHPHRHRWPRRSSPGRRCGRARWSSHGLRGARQARRPHRDARGRRRGRSPRRRRRRGRRRPPRPRTRPTRAGARGGRRPSRTESSRTVHRSASAPTSSRPPSGQPRLAWPLAVAARSRLGASWLPRTRLANRSWCSTARDSSNRSITACESEPRASADPASRSARAGPIPSARSRSVVGHRHTVVRLAPKHVDVGVGEVGRVDGGEALAEQAVPVEEADGCDAVGGDALFVLGRLLRDVAVQRDVALGGPRPDDLGRRRVDRPHGVDRGADARRRRCQPVEVRGAGRPPERIAVAEAPLNRIQLDPDAAVQVAGVEQRDANAGRCGGGDQRRPHRVRIVIWNPTGVVVDVVELADARDAGERHLAEHRSGEPVVRLRRQALGRRVHLLAPRPERADADLGGAPQQPVERVTVGVGEARQREAGEAGRRRRRFGDGGSHGRDAITVDVDRNAGGDGVAAEPRQLAPVARRHEPTRRTNSVIRLTNASR